MKEMCVDVLLSVQEEEAVTMDIQEDSQVELTVGEGLPSGSTDYNDLVNKPKLNGKTIQGDVEEEDPTVPQWAKQPEKPSYTPEEVGISAISLSEIADMFKNW